METSIIGVKLKKNLKTRVFRRYCPGILGLLFFVQLAWSGVVISPSPSYNGSYTVSWSYALGCTTYYDDFGTPWDVCNYMSEQTDGSPTGYWYSGGPSMGFSGKRSATYTYTITAHYVSYYWGVDTYQTVEGPTSVQVILPVPTVNFGFPVPYGPAGNPNGYYLTYGSANADPNGCQLNLGWVPSGATTGWVSGYATSGTLIIGKTYAGTTQIVAKMKCTGPGGTSAEATQTMNFPL